MASPLSPRDRLAVLARLVAARAAGAASPRARAARDPLERLAWIESGAVFEAAGVVGFLDGIPPIAGRLSRRAGASGEIRALVDLVEAGDGVPLGDLYIRAVPRRERHARGEYFTPTWLAEHVLDRAGFDGRGETRLIDPMCGAGAFLTAAIARIRKERCGADTMAGEIVRRVHGVDISPLAVLLARASYLEALIGGGIGHPRAPIAIPVRLGDAILSGPNGDPYDIVAGNPPWIGWEHMTARDRDRTRPLWIRHGLFPDGRGMQVMLGRGRKDLSMLATCAAADGWLREGGRLSFVIALSVFKSVGGGAGFRRFRLGDGTPLRVVSVDDFGSRRVFFGASTSACVLTLDKGRATRYPVPYCVWGANGGRPRAEWAAPVDAADPGSAWITASREDLARIGRALGASSYRARAGAYTGGANGVYWVAPVGRRTGGPPGTEDGRATIRVRNVPEAGKREVPGVRASLEADLLFPLLRASDIGRFAARPTLTILLPQDPDRRRGIDEAVMAARYAAALAYLGRFRRELAARRDRGTRALIAAGAPFYSIFSVSRETLSPWKVVWPRIASRVTAAAVGPLAGRPVVPQETCTFIACSGRREACYLAGLLNSSLFHEAASAFGQAGGKSFGAPHLLRHIRVPRFDPRAPAHDHLAALVDERRSDLPQPDLDTAAAPIWGA